MIFLLGGPDRVGKSTLASELSDVTGHPVVHHTAPDSSSQRIFDCYYRNLANISRPQIWDRSYVCAYILERFRKNTHDHISEIVDLELTLREHHKVIHIGVVRPWHWTVPLHLKEIDEEFPDSAKWFKRDMLMARQSEHHYYVDQMLHFYRVVTMFPHILWDGTQPIPDLLQAAEDAINNVPT